MTDKTKFPSPELTPPPIPLARQLLVAGFLILIAGIVVLFGAVLGLGSQVSKNNKL